MPGVSKVFMMDYPQEVLPLERVPATWRLNERRLAD
jgi:hypothetical protein